MFLYLGKIRVCLMKNAMFSCKWACILYMSEDVIGYNWNCLTIRSFASINSIYHRKKQDQMKSYGQRKNDINTYRKMCIRPLY